MTKFDALTGWRFLAALVVIFWHLQGVLWLGPDALGGLIFGQGVSLFFVLSGFVLQYAYRDRIEEVGAVRFLGLRIARIWPLHVVVLGLIALQPGVFDWYVANLPPDDAASVILLTQAWHAEAQPLFSMNSPSWSLSAELFFYAMFPFLTGPMSRNWPLWLALVTGVSVYWVWSAPNTDFIWANPVARLYEFAFGMAAYEIHRGKRIPGGTIPELIAVALAAGSLVLVSRTWAQVPDAGFSEWFKFSGSSLAFTLLILVFARQQGLLSKLLATPPAVWLGDISFAIYLVHQQIIIWFAKADLPVPLWQEIGLVAAAILGLSALLHHLVELPIMKGARYLMLRPASSAKAPPAT